jgi:hypothetical protein
MFGPDYEAAVPAFVHTKGVSLHAVWPTQATIAARDRTALEDYAAKREGRRWSESRH